MMKMPSIKDYLINPDDAALREVAFRDFSSFKKSFLSKSVFWVSDTNHEFWSDMKYGYVVNPNNPDESWYNMTLYETEEYNFNINYDASLKTTNLWVNAVVKDNGKPVGVIGPGILLTNMIKSIYAGFDPKITMYLYNDSLEITGSLDSSILEKKLSLIDEFPHLSEINNKPTQLTFESVSDGEYLLAPLRLIDWHMVLVAALSSGNADLTKRARYGGCGKRDCVEH